MNYKIIAVVLVGVLLAVGVIAFLWQRGAGSDQASLIPDSWFGSGAPPPPPLAEAPAAGAAEEWETYENAEYGFAFRHPAGFGTTEFAEGEGDMVLAQGKGGKRGFQVYITPFDEPGPITLERIRKDLPTLVMEEPQQVTIALKSEIPNPKSETNPNDSNSKSQTNGVPVLVFFSRGESFGRTREVWFIWPPDPIPHGNYLYQITAPAEFDQELSRIMGTWIFR